MLCSPHPAKRQLSNETHKTPGPLLLFRHPLLHCTSQPRNRATRPRKRFHNAKAPSKRAALSVPPYTGNQHFQNALTLPSNSLPFPIPHPQPPPTLSSIWATCAASRSSPAPTTDKARSSAVRPPLQARLSMAQATVPRRLLLCSIRLRRGACQSSGTTGSMRGRRRRSLLR